MPALPAHKANLAKAKVKGGGVFRDAPVPVNTPSLPANLGSGGKTPSRVRKVKSKSRR